MPVFADVQNAIKRKANEINRQLGDDLEKGGEDAGKRMGDGIEKGQRGSGEKAAKAYTGEFRAELTKTMAEVGRELKPLKIKVKVDKQDIGSEFAEIKADFLALSKDLQLKPGMDAKKVYAELSILETRLAGLQHDATDLEFKTNLDVVEKRIKAFLTKVRSTIPDIEIPFHIEQPDRELGAFERKIKASAKRAAEALGEPLNQEMAVLKEKLAHLGEADLNAGEAEAKLRELTLEADRLSKKHVNIGVDADAGKAAAELLEVYTFVRALDGKDVDIKVDVNDGEAEGKLAGLKAALFGASGGGQNASNSFRSFNAVILAAVTLLPALIPILAAVGGGLLALGPLAIGAGAGFGAMIIGFSGISAAVQAFSAKQKKSAADTEQATESIRSALYGVRDAQQAVQDAERSAARSSVDSARAVAQARQSAAESIRSALETQRQAQEAYANSVVDVQDAEKSLAEAREAQRRAQLSTKNQIADNKLAIRQAVLGAFDATNNLNAVNADGASTTYDKQQAKLAYDQAQQQLKELRDTRKQLAQDKKKQDKEGISGSDAVTQAQEALTHALQQQKDAQIAVGDAAHAVNLARIKGAQEVQQAELQQSRAAEDGQESIAKAQEQLRRAQESYNDALKKSNDIGTASDQNLKAALANLGPAGRKFARFIVGLQKEFYELRGKIQEALLPPVQHAIERILNKYGPQLQGFLITMAGQAGHFFTELSKSFDSKPMQRMAAIFEKLAPVFFSMFSKITIEWLKIFAQLMADAAPYSLQLSRGLLGMSKSFDHFLASKKGREGVQSFMDYARKVGPAVVSFLANFVKAAVNLARALAPWGGIVLKALSGFFKLIASIPPKDLGLLVTNLLGLFIAFQVGVGSISLFLGGLALLANPFGLIIAGVVLAIVVLTSLYIRFKVVRTVVNIFINIIKIAVKIIFEYWKIQVKAYLAIGEFVFKLLHLKQVGQAVFGFLKKYVPPILDAIRRGFDNVKDAVVDWWDGVRPILIDGFAAVMTWLWQKVVGPILGFTWGAFQTLGRIIRKVWNGFIFPILDLMIHIFTKLAQKIWIPLIKQIWGTFTHMGSIFHTVYHSTVKPVLDAFGAAGAWLWKKALKPAFDAAADGFEKLGDGMKVVYDHTIKPIVDAFIDLMGGPDGLRSKFHDVVEAIKLIWDGLKEVLTAPIRFVMGTVLNKGLIAGFNKVANFVGSKPMSEFHNKALGFARGGVLPGYTPGRDTYRFSSPTGGQLNLSGGEAIMRPEWTKAVGPGFVKAMNAIAAQGGVGGVKRAMGFAKGGVFQNPDAPVSMNGKKIAAIAAAQILLAEKLNRRKYYLMQGGYGGDHIAASGTSHNYPGVGDISTASGVNFADQTMLRKVGFAAWARNIPGAAYVGSGEHVHSVSRLSPGTSSSPQIGDYLNGTDGMGGPDYGARPSVLAGIANQLSAFNIPQILAGLKGHHGLGFGLPGWLLSIAKNPLGYFTKKVTDPIGSAFKKFGDNPYMHEIAGVPLKLVKGVAEKVIGLIPGGHAIMAGAGNIIHGVENIGDAVSGAVSGALHGLHFADGGVLPYNGTMKYDSGGYLPPGLTSVVNLTGRPEPVFTHDQFEGMHGGGAPGGPLVGEMNFNGTELTAGDVMDEFDFALRKMGRSTGRGPNSRSNH